MNRNRWILVAVAATLAILAGMLYGYFTRPSTMPNSTPPPVARKAAPVKKAAVKPVPTSKVGTPTSPPASIEAVAPPAPSIAPAAPAVINIYNCNNCPAATVAPAAPAAVVLVPPTPSAVQPPASPLSSSSCSEADNYYCGTPPPATLQSTPAASFRPPGRTVNVLSGNTFQLNILSGNGGWHGAPRYGYSTYGWTPGHEELRFDPRTGTYYRTWIAHPHPGY